MKKLTCIALLSLSLAVFGWERTSEGFIQMSDKEKKQYFGTNKYCADLGYSYLNTFLIEDGKATIENQSAYENFGNNIIQIGEKVRHETSFNDTDEITEAIAYYTVNCEIPSESLMEQWGSPTFNEIMKEVKSIKSQIGL